MLNLLCSLFYLLVFVVAATSACSLSTKIQDDYKIHRDGDGDSSANMRADKNTTFVFVIDGLGYQQFLKARSQMPKTLEFFCGTPRIEIPTHCKALHFGLAEVPSLTFPNMVSLLTASTVDQHDITGNQLLFSATRGEGRLGPFGGRGDSEVISLEKPSNARKLNGYLNDSLIFSDLKRVGKTSTAFAWYFYAGATAHISPDIDAGLSVAENDWVAIDKQNLESLARFLRDFPSSEWPSLVFVHLVSWDHLAHESGTSHGRTLEALSDLDTSLVPIFRLIQSARAQLRPIVTLFTSDHGFTDVSEVFDLQKNLGEDFFVLPQGRVATIRWRHSNSTAPSEDQAEQAYIKLFQKNKIKLMAWRFQKGFKVASGNLVQYFDFFPANANAASGLASLPDKVQVVRGLANWFSAPSSTDAIAFAASKVSFDRKSISEHGGLLPEEMQTLILLKGASLKSSGAHPSEILKFLKQ